MNTKLTGRAIPVVMAAVLGAGCATGPKLPSGAPLLQQFGTSSDSKQLLEGPPTTVLVIGNSSQNSLPEVYTHYPPDAHAQRSRALEGARTGATVGAAAGWQMVAAVCSSDSGSSGIGHSVLCGTAIIIFPVVTLVGAAGGTLIGALSDAAANDTDEPPTAIAINLERLKRIELAGSYDLLQRTMQDPGPAKVLSKKVAGLLQERTRHSVYSEFHNGVIASYAPTERTDWQIEITVTRWGFLTFSHTSTDPKNITVSVFVAVRTATYRNTEAGRTNKAYRFLRYLSPALEFSTLNGDDELLLEEEIELAYTRIAEGILLSHTFLPEQVRSRSGNAQR